MQDCEAHIAIDCTDLRPFDNLTVDQITSNLKRAKIADRLDSYSFATSDWLLLDSFVDSMSNQKDRRPCLAFFEISLKVVRGHAYSIVQNFYAIFIHPYLSKIKEGYQFRVCQDGVIGTGRRDSICDRIFKPEEEN